MRTVKCMTCPAQVEVEPDTETVGVQCDDCLDMASGQQDFDSFSDADSGL